MLVIILIIMIIDINIKTMILVVVFCSFHCFWPLALLRDPFGKARSEARATRFLLAADDFLQPSGLRLLLPTRLRTRPNATSPAIDLRCSS